MPSWAISAASFGTTEEPVVAYPSTESAVRLNTEYTSGSTQNIRQAQHRIYVRLNTEYTSGSTQNIRQAQHRIYAVEPRSPIGQKKVSSLVRCPHFRGWNGCKSGTNWGVLFR